MGNLASLRLHKTHMTVVRQKAQTTKFILIVFKVTFLPAVLFTEEKNTAHFHSPFI